jgi:mono/diheme cytochrome c family protein
MTAATRTLATAGLSVLATLALAAALTTRAPAKPVTYTLPAESSTLKKTPEPGYQRADLQCVTCHSRDYITTQPRGKGKEFWTAEITKMVNVYAAPIPEPDRAVIADYLAANY